MKKGFMGKIRHPGVFLKILALFEVILIAAVIITSTYIINRFSATVMEKEIMLGDTNLDKLSDFGNDKYNRIYSLYNYIHSGPVADIIVSISDDPQAGYDIGNIETVNVFEKGVISADPDISDVVIASMNGVVYSYSGDGYQAVRPSFNFLEYEAINNFIESEESIRVVYDDPSSYTLKKRDPVISFMGKIFDPGLFPRKNLRGIFIMNVPLQRIMEQEWAQGNLVEGELILTNSQDEVLFSTKERRLGIKCNLEKEKQDDSYYVHIKDVGTSGMRAAYMLPNESLLKEIRQINRQIYLMMVIAILLTMVICLFIYRVFSRQTKTLIQGMERLQAGDFHLRIPVKSKDEIGIISQAFNQMCEKLNIYISEVYAAEIQRKNAELNALQTQIDPHFLYNTLDSIRARALDEQAEDTAEMVVLLGKLFRWSSKTKDKFIPLEDELEYIAAYLKLQRYRYAEKLEVDIQVPEEYLDYIVPKLILQPLVENVIKHAFTGRDEEGLIGINVRVKNDSRLEITVFDNGVGMDQDDLQEMYTKLNQVESQDEFKSIGLQNVQTRIRLLFGEEYGLQIRSIRGKGTAVKVALPVLTEKDVRDDVPIIDC